MNKKLILVVLVMIMAVVMAIPSHAETIWEKRQKVMQGAEETNTAAPKAEPAVQEEETIPGEYPEEEADLELAPEDTAITQAIDETDPYMIIIPEEYGTIIESYKGTKGKLIVHVQDAHANYEAQMNEANIIESLINDYGLKLILTEGGSTNKDFSYLRKEGSLDVRKKAADKLLKNATITGVDYIDVATDYPLSFQGVEDRALYDQNRDALWEMDKFKDVAAEYTGKMAAAIDALKPKIYSEALLNIDKAKNDYDNEAIDLVAYYEALNKAASDKNIPLDKFQSFSNVVKINDMEKKIDLAKINDGTATEEQKAIYKEYKDLLANLNVNKLFKEEPLVEKTIHDALFENEDQKKLYNVSKAVSLLDKMLRVKVVPEEYGYFLENKLDFNPQNWAGFLKQKSTELNIDVKIPENYYIITDNLSSIQKFYDLAGERDEIFLKKTAERMEKDSAKLAVLVAGGFHTPKLTRLLADNGYSYIVISPRVTTPTDEELYRSSLKKEWIPE